MSSSMLIPHTNTLAVRSRPTPKDVERFRDGSVRELKEKERDTMYSMIPNGRMDRLSTKHKGSCKIRRCLNSVESSCSTFVPFVVNVVIFLMVLNY